MSTFSVRQHTRRGKDGQKVTVSKHDKNAQGKAKSGGHRSKGRKPKASLARRSWLNLKAAFGAARKKKKAAALGFGLLAVTELTAYLTLQGVAFALVLLAGIAVATAVAANAAANMEKRKDL